MLAKRQELHHQQTVILVNIQILLQMTYTFTISPPCLYILLIILSKYLFNCPVNFSTPFKSQIFELPQKCLPSGPNEAIFSVNGVKPETSAKTTQA